MITFTLEKLVLCFFIGINLALVLWLIRLEIKSKDINLFQDKKSLRDKINSIENKLEELQQFGNKTIDKFDTVEDKLKNNIQNIEIVRFNPFKKDGVGGDQSFAITFLNKKGQGVVMSSLYMRDKVSVFAKPVENWQSRYELSEEETKVLNQTKNSL